MVFCVDKVNYARYLTPYYAKMTNLSETNPDVHVAFEQGFFSVQLSKDNPFGKIPVDQTTEVTVNKDTQTPGGTNRFSLKPATVQRYYVTAEYTSAFLRQLRDMVQGGQNAKHTDLQRSRIKKDEQAVSAVVELIRGWTNPFSGNQDLVSISTAKATPKNVTTDLMKAQEIGEKCYKTFKEERLEKVPQVKKFHDPLKANKLKTFSDLSKKKQVASGGKTVVLKADRSLFGRIVVMALGRNLQMEDILSHPLGPLPWALATPDGFLRKTNKAALATLLQKNVQPAEQIRNNSAAIIDGMSLVQKVNADHLSFGDVADAVLNMVLREGAQCKRIDVVYDTYKEMSIKNSERSLRGEESGYLLQNISSAQIVRQWRSFLAKVNNKTALISFIVREWQAERSRQKLNDKELYVTTESSCFKITSHASEEVPALQCKQEEADGRLLLHASHASKEGYTSVMICSEDTDVFIMSVAFASEIPSSLFIKCGSKNRTKVIDVNRVANVCGSDVCKAVIGMHAYTGCDSVSAFAGRGKAQALKLVISDKQTRETFTEVGEEWELSPDLLKRLEAVTCKLYASKTTTTTVNELRYQLFCAKRGEIESHQLPPCRDCLAKHSQRANYQAATWKRCLLQNPQVPSPVGRGWKIEREEGVEQLVVDWMAGKPAPEAILELLSCNCTKYCSSARCVCVANGMKCTDMCRLHNCENQPSAEEEESTLEDAQEFDSDDDY